MCGVNTDMQSSSSSSEDSKDDTKPTKKEVFRDFLVFRLNHREEEKLFRHDIFIDIVAQVYGMSRQCLSDMKQVEHVVLTHPLSHFIAVLRQCVPQLRGRMAKTDLYTVLNYAKEAL